MKPDIVTTAAWNWVAGDLPTPERDRTACFGEDLCRFLKKKRQDLGIPTAAETAPVGQFDCVVGWGLIPGPEAEMTLARSFRLLRPGGGALFYGFRRDPSPEDVYEWGRRCRELGGDGFFPLPLPGATELAPVIAALNASPFDHFGVRREGICFRALLRRGEGEE